jgi:hypothetical protein
MRLHLLHVYSLFLNKIRTLKWMSDYNRIRKYCSPDMAYLDSCGKYKSLNYHIF